ncbi:uncharacterized protein LOC110459509 isoform X3 [Mizuhopecten yessoensis]|uniref:uncharacterized protein LOC110459509 isoform X3 n=1 Tax=Mizuhopecten yessoensis TaxID=6573 RepID=UPI000B458AA2|nr:uncharacterized protein LOC110459509 isoform X3 [Mizuhopecten yessoensis]
MGMADKRLTVNFGAQVLRSVKKSRTSVTRYRSDFSSKIDQLLVSSRQEKMSKLNLQHQQKMRATQESMQQLRELSGVRINKLVADYHNCHVGV